MSRHTPGPWSYDYAPEEADFMILTADLGLIAHVFADEEKGITGATVEANARAICAAPDGLAFARAVTEWMNNILADHMSPLTRALYEQGMAFIARAEGREL